MTAHNLRKKIMRGAAGPEAETALATTGTGLPLSTAIAGLTETFARQTLESLDDRQDTPEHHVLEIYASLDRLHHYLEELRQAILTNKLPFTKLLSPEWIRHFQQLLEKLQTVTLRLNIFWNVEMRPNTPPLQAEESLQKFLRQSIAAADYHVPEETQTDFSGKYAVTNLLKSFSRYVSAIQETIEEKRGDFNQFCAPQCTDEAMELSAKASQDLRQLTAQSAPDEIPVYPGDLEYGEDEYDKVLSELEKMKEGNKLLQLFRLLAKNRSDIFLGDPEIRRHFTDREVRDFQLALYRTVANLTIGILDAIPAGAGESVSWTADALKILKRFAHRHQHYVKMLKKLFPEWLDLTPDISIAEAVISELSEIPTGGFIPSHLVFEFRKQFQADLPRLTGFLEKLSKVRARALDEKNDHYIRVLGLDDKEDEQLLKALKEYSK
jgi:hypothetical protein